MKMLSRNSFYQKMFQALLILLPVFSWAQPANDLCSGAVTITQDLNCNNTAGTLIASTYSALTTSCGAGTQRDVWYSFTAKSNTAYINVTTASPGANLRFQVYATTACGGTETSIACSGP